MGTICILFGRLHRTLSVAFPGQLGKSCVCKAREKHCGSLENLMICQDAGVMGCRPGSKEMTLYKCIYHGVHGEKSGKQQQLFGDNPLGYTPIIQSTSFKTKKLHPARKVATSGRPWWTDLCPSGRGWFGAAGWSTKPQGCRAETFSHRRECRWEFLGCFGYYKMRKSG